MHRLRIGRSHPDLLARLHYVPHFSYPAARLLPSVSIRKDDGVALHPRPGKRRHVALPYVPAYFLHDLLHCSITKSPAFRRTRRTTLPTGRPVRRDFSRQALQQSCGKTDRKCVLMRQIVTHWCLRWQDLNGLALTQTEASRPYTSFIPRTPGSDAAVGMQLLQRTDFDFPALQSRNPLRCRACRGQRGDRRNARHHRRAPDRLLVKPGLLPVWVY